MDIQWFLENPFILSALDCYVDTYIWIMKQDIVKWFHSYNFAKCIEPSEKEWSSYCSLFYNNIKYDICYTHLDEYTVDLAQNFSNKEIKEHLLVAKQNDEYFIRTNFPGHKPYIMSGIPCKVTPFIYVEYNHPNMSSAIELKIPEGMFMFRNELFTPAFVLRLLQHQVEYYYFDMDYILKIMDSSIVEIHLKSNQYIVMKSDEYIIQTI